MTYHEPPSRVQLDLENRAAVYWVGPRDPYPGWYCEEYRESGHPRIHRLWTQDPEDVQGAVQEAAQRLDCLAEQILIKKD